MLEPLGEVSDPGYPERASQWSGRLRRVAATVGVAAALALGGCGAVVSTAGGAGMGVSKEEVRELPAETDEADETTAAAEADEADETTAAAEADEADETTAAAEADEPDETTAAAEPAEIPELDLELHGLPHEPEPPAEVPTPPEPPRTTRFQPTARLAAGGLWHVAAEEAGAFGLEADLGLLVALYGRDGDVRRFVPFARATLGYAFDGPPARIGHLGTAGLGIGFGTGHWSIMYEPRFAIGGLDGELGMGFRQGLQLGIGLFAFQVEHQLLRTRDTEWGHAVLVGVNFDLGQLIYRAARDIPARTAVTPGLHWREMEAVAGESGSTPGEPGHTAPPRRGPHPGG